MSAIFYHRSPKCGNPRAHPKTVECATHPSAVPSTSRSHATATAVMTKPDAQITAEATADARAEYENFRLKHFGSNTQLNTKAYQNSQELKKELRDKFHAACNSFGFDTVDIAYDSIAQLIGENKKLTELYQARAPGSTPAASTAHHKSAVTYDEGLSCAAMIKHFNFKDTLEIGLAYGCAHPSLNHQRSLSYWLIGPLHWATLMCACAARQLLRPLPDAVAVR